MAYATSTDVLALVSRAIDASSEPTATEVTSIISTLDATLDYEMRKQGIDPTGVSAAGLTVLKRVVAHGAAAAVIRNKQSVMDDPPGLGLVDSYQEIWDEFVRDIRLDPNGTSIGLGVTTGDAGTFRSHVTHNSKSKTSAGGDFDPIFTREDKH